MRVEFLIQEMNELTVTHVCFCYFEAEMRSFSTFAHSIFEGSPLKEGFNGTHATPSGSATVYLSGSLRAS